MAKSKRNVVTYGLSGKIGDLLIFRQRYGETVVTKIPEQTNKVSEKQKAQRLRFRQAVIYGKTAIADPETKVVYDAVSGKKGKTAFNAAVADFLNAPEINEIDVSNYTGATGDTIKIEVEDDTLVKYVKVAIINSDGTLVEEGQALPDASGYVWIYTATQNNDDLNGDKIVVEVSDLPGNIVEESIMN
jgi:signal peptidase I